MITLQDCLKEARQREAEKKLTPTEEKARDAAIAHSEAKQVYHNAIQRKIQLEWKIENNKRELHDLTGDIRAVILSKELAKNPQAYIAQVEQETAVALKRLNEARAKLDKLQEAKIKERQETRASQKPPRLKPERIQPIGKDNLNKVLK